MQETTKPNIVSRKEWLASRKDFLKKEKELTRARDELNAERRKLPMVEIDMEYIFEGARGKASLLDLFEGRRQLIVHHVMFDPSWNKACSGCTHHMDDLGHLPHLHEKNTTLAVVSRAPLSKIVAYKKEMGWTFPWYSSFGSDFNYDFHVTLDEAVTPLQINFRSKKEHEKAVGRWDIWGTELPGVSVFLREDDRIFHTYSTYSRGLDILLFSLNYLDLTPLGR
ncbi:Predicted dithiol-disulfide oxidoreductase, DUF899 family [Gracilibacillus orientalis]|uniref:Predicted dithiol-disulfide oxidoreductase, DUF899 family n=1 Tax=Gracilibacillus orientalis TaxID=334253 RepID=A0A1I4N880_9BACI|nr:DUF899 domain-containing protein [Gracilibacillus orientalis]SFM11453.1 Predicted dithiol-disulfide oxidoreductase, DUF899 family [Gracilibacillus orientalis]